MKATLKDGKLTIVIDANTKDPQPSKSSGKTLTVATTNGNIATDIEVSPGKFLVVGVNAYIKNDDYVKPAK